MREAYTTRKASLKLADWYTAGILCRMLIIWATNRAEREPTDAEVQAMYTDCHVSLVDLIPRAPLQTAPSEVS
ncbi:hypothetical protein WJX84_008613 [Apatococcus fuscideae]|uniref:Uncharacterized protein n=1 Tax=Apatococcus fuscideae TaxID=2026836 RepID=A0AAW1TBS5_9CHLO